MPSTNIRVIVTRTLALPVLLLISLALVLSFWIVRLLQSETRVQHTYDVIADISETQKQLIDQETGLRAYILTADPRMLAPYESGTREFGPSLDLLAKTTADNPRQGERIEELRQRYRYWVSEAEVEKQIVSENREPVLREAASRDRLLLRKHQMDGMRADFKALQEEEKRLLAVRQGSAKRANRILFGVGSALVLGCAAILFFFLRRQLGLIDAIYLAKVEESERARYVAEGLAAEVGEQAAAMEEALLKANRERAEAVRALNGSR
ncbi:MAG TPA: CHASE3 domain-containing protein [Thermoanaerobaculia bacterium]|jgi:methyl-accepting chemotaxis protein|nr:CHASE3 domain-containing protein [Thermoanaerobaculia bacterium]